MFYRLDASIVLAAGLLAAPGLLAQGFSYDGNRWYEIEVSIFSNDGGATTTEQVVPEHATLDYFSPARQLVPAIDSFLVPFPGEVPENDLLEDPGLFPVMDFAPVLPVAGAEPAPVAGNFHMTDFNREPYIALGPGHARFTAYNLDIERSPEHRLLFHAVWRQPVLNLVQATAITVAGGDAVDGHNELEGSLRFSYDINRVDVEARLWLARFSPFAGAGSAWQLPPRPGADATPEGIALSPVTDIAFMEQERAMVSNELHYLDHPALGMLVEIRPYQLPERASSGFE